MLISGGRRRFDLGKKRRRGATVVEFSLVFMLFLVVITALIEFSRVMWTYATLAHVTRLCLTGIVFPLGSMYRG